MLSSGAREILTNVEAVIVDEIHAVAATKRGSHLALTLERLAALQHDGNEPQRIGLSATQNPLEEVGRFMVGPRRSCTIVDAGVRKPLDLQIHVPVESMKEPEQGLSTATTDPLEPLISGEATRQSIWPAIYPEILRLVKEHRSTIVFVNARRGAERLAIRLNELANKDLPEGETPKDIARAHHGSLAHEERLVVEEMLKAGELPCLVATSSLELGIDMGAVDLVLQVESPKSVARGLQRIGRAGHNVGDTSKGRIFPKFRADLLECAVVCKLMRGGEIEPTVVPRNALDVLAQQIVSIATSTAEEEPVSVDDLYALVTRTHSYAELSPRAARERPRHARRPLPVGRVRRAARPHRLGPRRGHDPRPQGLAPARRDERRHDPRPRPVQRRPARRPPRRRARRGDGLRGARGPDVPARRVDLADRGDRPRPRDRHAGAGCAGRGAVLERRRRRPAQGARQGDRRVQPLGRRPGRRDARSRLRPRPVRRLEPARLPQRAGGRDARRAVGSHDRRRALPRRDRRLAAMRPVAVRRTRARGVGPGAQPQDPRAVRPRVRRDLVRRRDHRPPARRRRAAGRGARHARARRDRGRGRRGAGIERAVRRALPRERRPRAAHPARLSRQAHAAVAAAAEVAVAARGRQALPRLPDHPRDLPRVPARRARRPRPRRDRARPALARAVAGRSRDADRVAVRLVAAVRLRRDVHVRGRRAQRRAARRRAVAGPRPAARAARPGGAARAHRRAGARAGRGRPPAPLEPHARRDARRARRRVPARRRSHDATRCATA